MFRRKPRIRDHPQKNPDIDYDDPFADAPDESDLPPSMKNEKPGLLEKISMQSKSESAITGFIFFGTFLFLFYIIGVIMLLCTYHGSGVIVRLDPLHYLFSLAGNGNPSIFIMTLLFSLLIAYALARQYSNYLILKEDNFIIRAKSGAQGASDWIDKYPKEFNSTFDTSGTLDDPGYVPIGIFKDKVCSMPENPKFYQFTNQNIAVIAGSGSGKSYSVLTPIMRSRIRYGESFIITDTKGDLYRKNAQLCKDNGYHVMLFNTKDFAHSDSWDCLDDLARASEKDIFNYVDIFSNTFMRNTQNGEKEDYWFKNEHDLLRSLMHLISRDKQYEGKRTFEELINLINSPETHIRECLMSAEGRVQQAARSYLAATDDKLRENYRSGLANRLQIYRTPLVARALSAKGIDLERAAHEKTAIFVVTKDSDSTYDAITSLFVGCLYMKLIEMSDSAQYKGSLKVPFWFILDELCNMGAIDALPRKISTSRSRKINFVFALQSMSQLDDKYVRMANNILANCALKIILGCDDEMTAKYVSAKAGSFTQVEYTEMAEKPYAKFLRKLHVPLEVRVSKRESKKNLIEVADVSQIPAGKMYALIARHHVFRGDTYGEDMHYMEKLVSPLEVDDYVGEWYEQFEEEHPEMKDSPDRVYIPSDYEKMDSRLRVAKRNPYSKDDIITLHSNQQAEKSSIDGLRGRITGERVSPAAPPPAPEGVYVPPKEQAPDTQRSSNPASTYVTGDSREPEPSDGRQSSLFSENGYGGATPQEDYDREDVAERDDDIFWDDEIF